MSGGAAACARWWEALRADPVPWLLDEGHPAVVWKVLTDLIGRPPDAPAVRRACGGGDASEPLATLLAPLDPDGTWQLPGPLWTSPEGGGWRLVAAVQLGADPTDPRLDAAARRLVAQGIPLEAGMPCVAARVVEALAGLRWTSDPALVELLAWLEEGAGVTEAGGWCCDNPEHYGPDGGCTVTAVAVMAALAAPGMRRRPVLATRARESILRALGEGFSSAGEGWPNLLRTTAGEMLLRLAMAGVPWDPRMHGALRDLQSRQDAGGRWPLEVAAEGRWNGAGLDRPGDPSRWLTLHAMIVLGSYAVAAGLPRRFPGKPSPGSR